MCRFELLQMIVNGEDRDDIDHINDFIKVIDDSVDRAFNDLYLRQLRQYGIGESYFHGYPVSAQ
jgi:hypothetical protein